MAKVRVCVDLAEETFEACRWEAEKRGVDVEALVERMVNALVQEMERDTQEGADLPIIPC